MTSSILQRAIATGNPLMDGSSVTFIWQGKTAPRLAADFSGWEPEQAVAIKRLEPGIWHYQVDLPSDAYIEYTFVSAEDPGLRLPDPLNPRRTPTGFGKFNHYFYMPDAAPSPWLKKRRSGLSGTVSSHPLETGGLVRGKHRTVHLYSPVADPESKHASRQGTLPLLVIFDGGDYLRRARLPFILDNLITSKRISPLALALVENGGSARLFEYSCAESTLMFLRKVVLPFAQEQLDLIDIDKHPGAYGVMGASLGGLMAVYCALRLPQIFGKALSQSGAFQLAGLDTVVFDLVRYKEKPIIQFWLDVGVFDYPALLESNRRFYPHLLEHGYTADYREYIAGHNYPAWRDDLAYGLEYLFGVQ